MHTLKKTINNSELIDLGDYTRDTGWVLSRKLDISLDEGMVLSKKIVDQNNAKGLVNIPKVKYYGKNQYGDRVLREKPLPAYIKGSNSGIIAPSGTVYKTHDKELSLHAKNTKARVKKRSACKLEGFLAEQRGDTVLANQKEKFQKTYKTVNNSLTGLLDNQYNPHYCPSSHYTCTSVTASVTSIGNSLGESMNSGNRMYIRPDVVTNHIVSTATNTDISNIELLIRKYNLHIPSIDDCMYVILKSTRFYWSSEAEDIKIRGILELCTDAERAAFVYINDFYHMRYYNPELIRTFIGSLIEVTSEPSDDLANSMKDIPEDIEIFAKTAMFEDMMNHAKRKEVVSFKDDEHIATKEKLSSTSKHMKKVLATYDDLLGGFYRTNNLPINISDIKQVVRKCTVLSDTDSTCATYQDWVLWYFRTTLPKFVPEEVAVTGAVLLIFTRTLSHHLELFSKRMNIRGEYVKLLAMKNEFYWNVMVFTGMTKHYFADIAIREGNVFRETKLELKGSNLINSTLPAQIKKLSDDYFKKINRLLTSGATINLHDILVEIAGVEKMILGKLKNLDSDVLKEEIIMDANGYKNAKEKSPYINVLLWNEVFAPKYGDVKTLPAVMVKLKTIMTTKKKMMDGIELIDDEGIRRRFKSFLEKYPRDQLGILRIPKEIVIGSGVPRPLEAVMTFRDTVEELCKTFYVILLTLGYFKKSGTLISDIYGEDANKKIEATIV